MKSAWAIHHTNQNSWLNKNIYFISPTTSLPISQSNLQVSFHFPFCLTVKKRPPLPPTWCLRHVGLMEEENEPVKRSTAPDNVWSQTSSAPSVSSMVGKSMGKGPPSPSAMAKCQQQILAVDTLNPGDNSHVVQLLSSIQISPSMANSSKPRKNATALPSENACQHVGNDSPSQRQQPLTPTKDNISFQMVSCVLKRRAFSLISSAATKHHYYTNLFFFIFFCFYFSSNPLSPTSRVPPPHSKP